MKIIDKKGKLFGLINIIDLVALLVLVLLVVGGGKRMKNKPVISNESTEAYITFEVSDIRDVSVKNIVEGDKLFHYDRNGYIGIIEEVKIKPFTEKLEDNGQWVDAEVPGKYTATMKVKANVKNTEDVVYSGEEQTRVGIQYRVKNKRIAVMGTVIDMEILD